MSMSIGVSKDLDSYKEDIIPGMDARESLYALTAVLLGAGFIGGFILVFGMDLKYAVYAGTPFVAPVVFLGFGKTHGMYYDEIFLLMVRQRRSPKTLLYQSTERESQILSLIKQVEDEKNQEIFLGSGGDEMKKMKRKLVLCLLVFFMLLIAAGILMLYKFG